MSNTAHEPLDHELKMARALVHLRELDREISGWLNGDHHSVRPEGDPKAGTRWLATAENPPLDPISLLIGDCLHNLRSALDLLAFELARAYTTRLPDDFAETSQFPIFGDEDRAGKLGVGGKNFHNIARKTGYPAPSSGLEKIRGWHPDAKAVVEGLQPYHRGKSFRIDQLWVLHDLDRVSKHRLLHTTVASSSGIGWIPSKSVNVAGMSPGVMEAMPGFVETDTPIGRTPPFIPMNPDLEMHVEIQAALNVAFAQGTPCVEEKPVLETMDGLYSYLGGTVIPTLIPFL